jgi:hypothetical protein
LHGIKVRKRKADGLGDPGSSGVRIRRISVHYEDGRAMIFIPEVKEEYFSQDDAERVVGILRKASSALEWGRMPEGYPAPERGGGLI